MKENFSSEVFHLVRIDSYIPVTKAKTRLLDMIRMIDDSENTVAMTKNGVLKAVLMSMDQYEAMRETMTILEDSSMMAQIRHFQKDIKEKKPLVDL